MVTHVVVFTLSGVTLACPGDETLSVALTRTGGSLAINGPPRTHSTKRTPFSALAISPALALASVALASGSSSATVPP